MPTEDPVIAAELRDWRDWRAKTDEAVQRQADAIARMDGAIDVLRSGQARIEVAVLHGATRRDILDLRNDMIDHHARQTQRIVFACLGAVVVITMGLSVLLR